MNMLDLLQLSFKSSCFILVPFLRAIAVGKNFAAC